MTFKDEIDAFVKSAISDMGEIRAELAALEHAMPAACGRTRNIRHIMMTLATRMQGIKVTAAKEVMVGNEEPATRQDLPGDMELFAGRGSGRGGLDAGLLESLHRVADHSLDAEEDEHA